MFSYNRWFGLSIVTPRQKRLTGEFLLVQRPCLCFFFLKSRQWYTSQLGVVFLRVLGLLLLPTASTGQILSKRWLDEPMAVPDALWVRTADLRRGSSCDRSHVFMHVSEGDGVPPDQQRFTHFPLSNRYILIASGHQQPRKLLSFPPISSF